jgi:hypothetical protein
VICPTGNTGIGRSGQRLDPRRLIAPPNRGALISNTNRCGRRSDHPHGRVGVAGAVEVDVNDPQNEHSNECGGNGFHKLLMVMISQGFRNCDPHRRYDSTEGVAEPITPSAIRGTMWGRGLSRRCDGLPQFSQGVPHDGH